MNSALKPVLTSPAPQNPPVTSQLNKPMHPQSAPNTYGQPSSHMPQGLVNLPHTNSQAAHSHPNPAHQTNHYSLNVPNAPQLYAANNPAAIPASNHPIPNQSSGQTYPPKNVPFVGGYQPNLGHPPNVNPLPPVSQTLPATQLPAHPVEASSDKPQSNGTAEIKSPTKPEPQENHVAIPRDKSPVPPASPKLCEKQEEKPSLLKDQSEETERKKSSMENITTVESSSGSDSEEKADEGISEEDVKNKEETERMETSGKEQENENSDAVEVEAEITPNKTKEKEQKTPKTTPRTPTRRSKTPKSEGESPKASKVEAKASQKSPNVSAKSKRTRIKTQPYQSPLPEIEIITKITSSTPRSKTNDEKLIVFYKNEFLAVRNSEGSFYICQAVQNIYKSSPKIRIRWLSQDKSEKSGEVYTPDFYDNTDFDCILTNLNLVRVDKGRYRLPPAEKERTDSILKRSLAVEKGEVTSPSLTEEHPDGIDLSLYKEESQLKKRKGMKRKASSSRKAAVSKVGVQSPDQAKVRKVVSKTRKDEKKTPAKVKKTTSTEVKKSTILSRTDRAKRRSDNQNHNRVSPVVDQKKAKVLAKVARKAVVSPTKTPPVKVKKASPIAVKVQKAAQKGTTRKTKRSSRK